jgi:hypothetical protein
MVNFLYQNNDGLGFFTVKIRMFKGSATCFESLYYRSSYMFGEENDLGPVTWNERIETANRIF